MLKSSKNLHGALALAAGSLLLVGAGCQNEEVKEAVAPMPESPAENEASVPSISEIDIANNQVSGTEQPTGMANKYKDGTYSAVGDYTYHSGNESVTIGITLKNDVITDTTFKGVGNVPPSQKFMDMFAGGYKAFVVGKNVDEVKLDKVSGSSRTPIGFNDALAKIKAQAAL